MIELESFQPIEGEGQPRDGGKVELISSHFRSNNVFGVRAYMLSTGHILMKTKDGTEMLLPPGHYKQAKPLKRRELKQWADADDRGHAFVEPFVVEKAEDKPAAVKK